MAKKLKNNILITACSIDPVGFNVIESLRPYFKKIVGVDTNEKPIIKKFIDKFYLVPLAKNHKYIPSIVRIAKKEKIDAILPLTMEESLILTKNKKILTKNKITIINENDYDLLKICEDKFKTINFLKNKAIRPLPKIYPINNIKEIKKSASYLKYPRLPFIIKPRITHGSRGFKIIKNKYNKFENNLLKKPNDNIYLNLFELINIFKTKRSKSKFLAMEFLKGRDYSVYGYARYGKPIFILPMERLGLVPGMSLGGLLKNNKKIIDYITIIVKQLKYNGIINIQLILTKMGPMIYEINPRIAATTIITKKAGINMPLLATLDALGYKNKADQLIKNSRINWHIGLYRIHKEIIF